MIAILPILCPRCGIHSYYNKRWCEYCGCDMIHYHEYYVTTISHIVNDQPKTFIHPPKLPTKGKQQWKRIDRLSIPKWSRR